MVAILLSVFGCDATQPEPSVSLPEPAELVSLHEPVQGERHRPIPHQPPPRLTTPDPGGFDLSQYRLLGVVWGEDAQALVVDPRGHSTVLEVGSPLGRADGRVSAITEAGVEIIEEFRAASGEVAVLTHTLTLSPPRR